jgi:hypothetical protein
MAVLPCKVKLLTEQPTTNSEASTRQAQMQIVALFCIIIASVLVYPAWAEDSQINVHDFGAKGDGKTDDTLAFQKALDQAGEKGGIVLVPSGQYRLDGVISVPEGVTLEGVWRGPHASQLDKGSTLLAYAGRDKENSGLHP